MLLSLPTLLLLPLALATNTSYPTKETISTIFRNLAGDHPQPLKFFFHVSPSVNWTIEGTHPAAGVYTNRSVLEATFARIAATGSEAHPLRVSVINIIGGADEEWSVEELQVYGVCRNGLIFDNRYAWATRWNTEKKIVEARAYLDSALVSAALQQNEAGTLFTYKDAREHIVPYVTLPQKTLQGTSGLTRQQSS